MYKAIFLFLLCLGNGEGDKKDIFTSPLEIPLTLSANFGELRPGHFHSGLDFKTSGVSGKKVLSVLDGYIYRISVSPGGFGNAVYIKHNNGYSTVYGHLDRFTREIEEYVTEYQYDKQSFNVNIFPEAGLFSVEQGEQIGFSGNSGSSAGPHLHFEIRKSANEHPIDPVPFFSIEDDIKPVINQLSLYPIGPISAIDGRMEKKNYSLLGSKGKYRLESNRNISVSGEFGIGISAWDFFSNSWNKCGVKSIEVNIDEQIMYRHSVDEFSFSNTRYINSHIDYEEYINKHTYIQKTFISPNNKLSIYDIVYNDGKFTLKDDKLHNIKVIVTDYSGNISELNFTVLRDSLLDDSQLTDLEYSKLMPFNQKNEFAHDDIRIDFPEDSFYDTLRFEYSKAPGDSNLLADIHYVHKRTVPVHKFFDLQIKPLISDSSLLSKACIVYINDKDLSYIGGIMTDGFFKARVRDLGKYSIGIDTIPPEINPLNFKSGSELSGRSQLRFTIKDDFSGIAAIEGSIDGEWALFEWDPKNDLLKYNFSKAQLQKGIKHNLELKLEDACGNETYYTSNFIW